MNKIRLWLLSIRLKIATMKYNRANRILSRKMEKKDFAKGEQLRTMVKKQELLKKYTAAMNNGVASTPTPTFVTFPSIKMKGIKSQKYYYLSDEKRLMVGPRDPQDAIKVLDHHIKLLKDIGGIEEKYSGPICPACGNSRVSVLFGKGKCNACNVIVTYKVEWNVVKWEEPK